MWLAQIGEFSFIIATLGLTLKVTSSFLYPIAVAVSVLTTLLTPYLIKSTDGLVNWFDRVAPKPLANSLEIYTRWVGQLGAQRGASFTTQLTRRWIGQVALNVALIAAVFIAAAYLERKPPGWLSNLQLSEDMLKAALWLAAVVAALPMIIATYRKLEAVGLLLAETRVSERAAGPRTAAIRSVVAQVVPVAGMAALGLLVLVLSSTLLPSLHVLLVLLVIVAIVTWLLWRSCIKVYSKAQVALQETLAHPAPAHPAHPATALPALLREADLETVTLPPNSPAVGKLIRELELRTRTGASIVGIERGGTNIINPGPDEELQPGDQVLLLGTRTQLDAAKKATCDG
jgi:CPA2 family monovalent cation:H+ antiporter-2